MEIISMLVFYRPLSLLWLRVPILGNSRVRFRGIYEVPFKDFPDGNYWCRHIGCLP